MVDLAASVWRDFVTDGVPASGANKPLKSKIRTWGAYLENMHRGSGLVYLFNATTTDADPGAGTFRLNNATVASATAAYLDNADNTGVTVSSIIDGWDDSTSAVRGVLTIRGASNPAIYHAFNVTGAIVDGTGYRKVAVAYVGGAGSLIAGDEYTFVFNRNGDGVPAGTTAGYLLQTNGVGSNPSYAGFLQAGTGAVTRTWQAKSRDVIHAADFGVVADGTTDDTAAMNLALAAAAGKRLILPGAVIKITAALNNITTSGTYIEGAGADSTKITTTHATADIFKFSGTTFGGVTGVGFTSSVTRTAGAAVQISTSDYIRVERCNFNAMFNNVRRTGNSQPCWINGNTFVSPAAGGSAILLDGNTSNVSISQNTGVGGATQPRSGVNIVASSGVWMTDNDMYQMGDGLLIEPATGVSCEHIFGSGNAWDTGNQNGINIIPAAGGAVRRAHFVNEWAATNTGRGIILQGAGTIAGFSYDNGFLYNNGQQGFIAANGSNLSVTNCAVSGNGSSATGTLDGLNIQPGIGEFRFIGNRCGATDGFTNTQRNGIRVETGASDNFVITNNDVRTNSVAGLVNNATGTNGVVRDNVTGSAVDEYVETIVTSGSPIALVTATAKDVATISLPAGDWDVEYIPGFTGGATTTLTYVVACVSSGVTNTLDQTNGRFVSSFYNALTVFNGVPAALLSLGGPTVRFSLTATTTIRAVAQAAFGVSTCSAFGVLRARRIR